METKITGAPGSGGERAPEELLVISHQRPQAGELARFNASLPAFEPAFVELVSAWCGQNSAGLVAFQYIPIPAEGVLKVGIIVSNETDRERLHDSFCELEVALTERFPEIPIYWMTFSPQEDLQRQAFFEIPLENLKELFRAT